MKRKEEMYKKRKAEKGTHNGDSTSDTTTQ